MTHVEIGWLVVDLLFVCVRNNWGITIIVYMIWATNHVQHEIPVYPANCKIVQIVDNVIPIGFSTLPITKLDSWTVTCLCCQEELVGILIVSNSKFVIVTTRVPMKPSSCNIFCCKTSINFVSLWLYATVETYTLQDQKRLHEPSSTSGHWINRNVVSYRTKINDTTSLYIPIMIPNHNFETRMSLSKLWTQVILDEITHQFRCIHTCLPGCCKLQILWDMKKNHTNPQILAAEWAITTNGRNDNNNSIRFGSEIILNNNHRYLAHFVPCIPRSEFPVPYMLLQTWNSAMPKPCKLQLNWSVLDFHYDPSSLFVFTICVRERMII